MPWVGGNHHTPGKVRCNNCQSVTKDTFSNQKQVKEGAYAHYQWDDRASDHAFFCPECQGLLHKGHYSGFTKDDCKTMMAKWEPPPGPPPPPDGQPPAEPISPPEPPGQAPAQPPRRQLTAVDLKEFSTPDIFELLDMLANELKERCAQAARADGLRLRLAEESRRAAHEEVTDEDCGSMLPIADADRRSMIVLKGG